MNITASSGTGFTRRRFLGAAAAGLTVLPSARLVRAYEANERLNLAVFGTMYNAQHFLTASHIYNAQVVAVCDPDRRNVTQAVKQWEETATRLEASRRPDDRKWAERYRRMAQGEGVTFYSDLRRMLDEGAESIDALVVSHYDHLHGVACGPALRAGRPVCTERPLGLNISEARKLRGLASETGRPVVYRSPGTAAGAFRRAIELVQEGAIGDVRTAHIWFKRGGPDAGSLPQSEQPVPEELDWDLWLGPLPGREYHPDWMAYARWRETSSGGLGTFGPHTGIFPFLTLKLRQLWDRPVGSPPIRVTAECARLNRISFPRWERIRWEIPDRGEMEPVTITWHHGPDFAPGTRELIRETLRRFGVESAEEADVLMAGAGSMLIGSEGALVADDHSVNITHLPRAKFAQTNTDRPLHLTASRGLYRDWIDAIRGEPSHILASFDNGGPLSEFLMLGNIATLFPEETLAYDPAAGRITNRPEANHRLGFEYRAGWSL